jgi:hypothetical protein
MSEAALLKTEVHGLREASSLLSKHIKVKKQQLRVAGSLRAKTYQKLIAQRDTKEELRPECVKIGLSIRGLFGV